MKSNLFEPDYISEGTPFKRIINVGAVPGGDAYLLDTGSTAVLFDSGFGCCGDRLVANLEKCLSGRDLDYILLSHSHYDHAPGSAWCAQRWRDVKIAASLKTKSVFSRPGAIAVMRKLDAAASELYGVSSSEDHFDELRVDIPLNDGELFNIGGTQCRMLLFPGHTNCSSGFWFQDSGLLLASETLGVYAGGETVTPAFLVGFQAGIDSIKKALEMDIRHMLVPHFGMIHGGDCRKFLQLSLQCSKVMWQAVTEGYKKGMTKDKLKLLLKGLFFTEEKRVIQPEEAFDLNSGYMIDIILNEYSSR